MYCIDTVVSQQKQGCTQLLHYIKEIYQLIRK